MKRFFILFLVLFVGLYASRADFYPKDPNIDVLSYTFKVNLSDNTDKIEIEAIIKLRFMKEGVTGFSLDLVDKGSRDDGKGMFISGITRINEEIGFTHENNRIGIRLESSTKKNEVRTYIIKYEGIPADGLIIGPNKHGDRTFFGDAWPNRARHWLATVDHPSDKAYCDFLVNAPAHYQVVSNGILTEQTDLDENRRLTHWSTKAPIPTKVMVIGVAQFAIQYIGSVDGKSIESWVYNKDRDAGFSDFSTAVKVTNFFNDHIGPYAYAKLANVQSKTRYGGMENSSCIFYSERAVSGRGLERLLAHEIAHQWFGDAISEEDWHHIWISEGFATYLTLVYMEYMYGPRRMTEGMERSRNSVVGYSKRRPDSPLVDTKITNPMSLLSTNSYQKGSWTLHMLRSILGDEIFWKGIRTYYKKFINKNVVSEDFQKVMEHVSGRDLEWYFHQWLYQPGQPYYKGDWKYDKKKKELKITINQVQENGLLFKMPVEFGIYSKGKTLPVIETLEVNKMENEFIIPLEEAPENVVLDPNINLLMESEFNRK